MAFQGQNPAAIGIKAPLPGFIEPALASPVEKVPSGSRWIHEIKFDGYRVQVHLANEAVRVFTRRGNDWTKRFRKIAGDPWHIKAGSAIIDGEVVVPAATTDFSALQNELKGTSIVLIAFHLLYLNGRDIRKLPLFERKAELKKIIAGTDVQFRKSTKSRAARCSAHACKLGLEGVVSKVRNSVYASGRGNNWVKKPCAQRETLTIAGYALDEGKWDSIYVGRRKGDDLIYAGKVDHGIDKASAADLQKRLKPLIRKRQPYAKRIAHKGIWVDRSCCRDRIPREVGGGQSPPSLLQGTSGGSLMDAFDRFWQWATKPLERQLTIPPELHRAVMELSPEARRDRAAVNQAAARVLDPER